jgi:DNA-directed RNA polymerase specialized sigma24 family protein
MEWEVLMGFAAVTVEGYENAAKQRPSGTNAAKTFGDPVGCGLLGVSAVPPLENTRPTNYSTLLGPSEKFHSPPLVATGQLEAPATLGYASEWKRIADGLRPLDGSLRSPEASLHPLRIPVQQVDHMHSVHGTVSGRAANKHGGAARQTISLTDLANVAASRILGLLKPPIDMRNQLEEHCWPWGPWDPYGKLVPDWNSELYSLAQAAYRGDYLARARFLNEIGTDESADNMLFIQDLLGPTFDPNRLDRRDKWEQREPADARRWLRKRLQDLRKASCKDKHELPYEENPDEVNPVPTLITPSKAAELMNPNGGWDRKPTHVNGATPSAMAEFMKKERERSLPWQLQAALPERQYQVLLCLAEGMKYEEIGYRLDIGVSTVKTHVRYLRQRHDLKLLLSS